MDWRQYASTESITPIDKAFPLAATSSAGSKPMAFGWDDAILGAGMGVQALASAFGANKQANTQAAIAEAQLQAQADALAQARDIEKGNLGLNLFNTRFAAGPGAEMEFARQARAQRMQLGEFLPKQMGLGREQQRWQTAFELSPEARELSRKERMGRLQETIAGYMAQPTGMFGPIKRINIEALAG
jgi:hypothetical protein